MRCFLLFYGCVGIGFNLDFLFGLRKGFLCLCCCLNRCCSSQVASGSHGKVSRT